MATLQEIIDAEIALLENDTAGYNIDNHSQQPTQTIAGVSIETPVEPVVVSKQFNVQARNDEVMDKDYERLIRMTQVVSKFSSTLCLRHIKVDLHSEPQGYGIPDAPAWSDSDSITFNRAKIGKLDDPAVVTALKGLSLHEICHILLTPRDGTVLVKNVRSDKTWNAFNALEDMRIEMFMVSRYSNVSEWLAATILEFLLKNPSQVQYQFPLVYGRKYLPVELRTMVRDSYVEQPDIPELEKLIDEYIVMNLADPSNYKRATEIIKRYDEIINKLNEGQGHREGWGSITDANGHKSRKNAEWKPGNGKALNKAQQNSIAVKVDSSNGEGYTDSAPSTGKPNLDAMGNAAGASGDAALQHDVLQDLLQDIYDRKQYEIQEVIKQYSGDAQLTGKTVKEPKRHQYVSERAVDFQAVTVSRSFGTELEQLRGEYDAAWDRRTESGRLNVQRYVAGCDVDEAFDQWELGREDAVDIEAVVLLDISGSMNWCIQQSYQSMWAIKRALDKINASTTVVTFGDEANLLYSADERASIQMRYAGTGGGTEPRDAIKYAHSVLANSTRAVKLIITITDGAWWDAKEADNMLRQLRKGGVLTALAYVMDPEDREDGSTILIDSHGCEIAANITDSRDLFTLARKLVKVGVARNLA